MEIWFVDMYDKNWPLAVHRGTVEINEAVSQSKRKADRFDADSVTWTTFTTPELAQVGPTAWARKYTFPSTT